MNRIDPTKVDYIRRAVRNGSVTQSELARRYGVSHTAIWKVCHGKSFKYVKEETNATKKQDG